MVSPSPVPTVVLLFKDARSFAPYQPQRDGRALQGVSGFFQSADTVNYIAMNAGGGPSALRLVMHEYTHSLIANRLGAVPAWFTEGLAQFYETLQVYDEGRGVVVGGALLQHLQALAGSRFSVSEFTGVEDSLSIEHPRSRAVFYSESWALVHYLMLASTARSRELQDYANRLAAGEAPAEAFAASFSDPRSLEGELVSYVRQVRFAARQYALTPPIVIDVPNPQPLPDAQAQAYLADLLFRTQRVEDARAALRRLVDADPANAHASATLGWLERSASRFDAALALLARAADVAPGDAAILAAYGQALQEQALRAMASRDDASATLGRAREVLTRALSLSPDNVTALVALARVETLGAGDLERANALLLNAIRLAPARIEYQLDLADVLVRKGDVAGATSRLQTIARHRTNRPAADAAAAMLARIAGQPPAGSPTARRLALRVVGEGERRVIARFTRMECTPTMMVLHLDTEAGPIALQEALGGTQFINYRPAGQRTFVCGPIADQPRVLATYRPWDGAPGEKAGTNVGIALAIEIVPDGYVPP
jgi:tetratricopeptide (TPR) repeat protein